MTGCMTVQYFGNCEDDQFNTEITALLSEPITFETDWLSFWFYSVYFEIFLSPCSSILRIAKKWMSSDNNTENLKELSVD